MMIPTDDDLGDRATVYGVRAHARFDLLTGRVRPFAVVGAGLHVIRASGLQMDDDTDRAYHWGGGARFALTPKLEARLDVRHLVVPDRTLDGATSDYEVTAGMTFRFGVAKRPAPRVEYVPPEEPVAEAPPPPPPPVPAPVPVIEELAGIGFEHDSATIDLASAYLLERAHAMLERDPTLAIEIAGHTSAEGDLGRNLTLSLHRAEAVKRYLVGRGIAASRILTVGHGAAEPIADNRSAEGRRRNRRIEFRVIPARGLPGEPRP
jgi:OOP family OmpA-OmpF porin